MALYHMSTIYLSLPFPLYLSLSASVSHFSSQPLSLSLCLSSLLSSYFHQLLTLKHERGFISFFFSFPLLNPPQISTVLLSSARFLSLSFKLFLSSISSISPSLSFSFSVSLSLCLFPFIPLSQCLTNLSGPSPSFLSLSLTLSSLSPSLFPLSFLSLSLPLLL